MLKRYLVVYDLKSKKPVYENGKKIIQYNNALRLRSLVDGNKKIFINGYAKWTDGQQILTIS